MRGMVSVHARAKCTTSTSLQLQGCKGAVHPNTQVHTSMLNEAAESTTHICQLCVHVWSEDNVILSEQQWQVWPPIDCWHG
jgi:hypothetical protein